MALPLPENASPAAWAVRMAETVLRIYPQEHWKWHYEHGLVTRAVAAVGERTGDPRFTDFAHAWVDHFVDETGEIRTYRVNEFNLDQVAPGRLLYERYQSTGDRRYANAIHRLRAQLREQPRTLSGGFWHKQIYPNQMWLDGLYMAGPFYAEYGVRFREQIVFDDLIRQFCLVEQHARDLRTGLLYHAWDESKTQQWANPLTGCSPHFWGRAIGWFSMALVDVLEQIPADHPRRIDLALMLERLAAAVVQYQDESGLWWQVVDLPERTGNYLETSVTAMLAYSLAKGVRKGWLERDYLEPARRAFDGLVQHKLRDLEDGTLALEGICSVAGLGGNPYRDGSFAYYIKEPVATNDFKGVGPFILAGLELAAIPH